MADLLARMRDVAPPAEEEGAILDLNRVIEDLFRLFDKSLFQVRKITAELDLDKGIPKLSLPAGAVKQILMNLVKNAAEAMSEGGTLRVSTRDRIYKNGSQYVELQVCDNGPGLPDQILSSLFKPVASTKQDHAGLGLAIVKNLLDRLSAEVTCSSATTGTRFQMLLPRTVEKSDQP
ncbi:MAG: ATP-binding protein [Desulfuromonadaceae bacterium]